MDLPGAPPGVCQVCAVATPQEGVEIAKKALALSRRCGPGGDFVVGDDCGDVIGKRSAFIARTFPKLCAIVQISDCREQRVGFRRQ